MVIMAVGQLLLSRKTREPRNTPNTRKDEVTDGYLWNVDFSLGFRS